MNKAYQILKYVTFLQIFDIFFTVPFSCATDFQEIKVIEYSPSIHKTPANYIKIVTDLISKLPTTHPCKSVNLNQPPAKIKLAIDTCNMEVQKQNFQKQQTQLLQQTLNQETEKKYKEEEQRRIQAQQQVETQRKLNEEVEKKRKEEEQHRIQAQQQVETQRKLKEEAEKKHKEEEQQRKAEEQRRIQAQQQVEEQRKLKEDAEKKHKEEEQHRIQAEKETEVLKKQKEEAEKKHKEEIEKSLATFTQTTQGALELIMKLTFESNITTIRPILKENSNFLAAYSTFITTHIDNLENDESIQPLVNYLRLPVKREISIQDQEKIETIEKIFKEGLEAVTKISENLEIARDTEVNLTKQDYYKDILDICLIVKDKKNDILALPVNEISPYLTKNLEIIEALKSILFISQLNTTREFLAERNDAFILLIKSDEFVPIFKLWNFITSEPFKISNDSEDHIFSKNVGESLTKLLGKDKFEKLNNELGTAIKTRNQLRQVFQNISEVLQNNEDYQFLNGKDINSINQFIIEHKDQVKKLHDQYIKIEKSLINDQVKVKETAYGKDPLIKNIKPLLIRINKKTGENFIKGWKSVANDLINAKNELKSPVEIYLKNSLLIGADRSDSLVQIKKCLEKIFGSLTNHKYIEFIQELHDISEPNILNPILPRIYEISKRILNAKEAHDALIDSLIELQKDNNFLKDLTSTSSYDKDFNNAFHQHFTNHSYEEYQHVSSIERSYLFTHLLKLLSTDFPSPPRSLASLKIDFFQEVGEEEQNKYKEKLRNIYSKYLTAQQNIIALQITSPSDKGAYIDFSTELTDKNNSLGAPPPPMGMLGGALKNEIIESIKEDTKTFVDKVKGWDLTLPTAIPLNDRFCGQLYTALVNFYSKLGNAYPSLGEIEILFKETAIRIFGSIVEIEKSGLSNDTKGKLGDYYFGKLQEQITAKTYNFPSLNNADEIVKFIEQAEKDKVIEPQSAKNIIKSVKLRKIS